MGRHKLYTEEEYRLRRKESAKNWAKRNYVHNNKVSIIWAKNNPEKVKLTRSQFYKKNKNIPIFRIKRLWSIMLDRCYNINNKCYSRYGGRGIKVCYEWKNDRKYFIEWALSNNYQLGLTIERINNNGNYEPSNCMFTTKKQQNNNRRDSIFIEYNGQKKTLAQWAEYFNIPKATLWWRHKQGHSFDKLFYQKHLQSHKKLIDEYLSE